MKFAQISDVHVRSASRHDEYSIIFEELYAKLKDIEPDHIVLCGDIAHTKTQESPEFYDFTARFVKNLANIADLHIILGNHDCNLLNADRLDVLSPIVNMLNNDRIHLYKNSQRADFDKDYSFFVYSICDKQNWNNWQIDSKRINIALYHGCVSGARTDLDYELEAEIDIKEFQKYDFTLLGDIHTPHQILDKAGRIRYVGSLTQQNYSEPELERGFLLWDIKSKNNFDVELIPVTPIHPFFTLDINDIDSLNIEDYKFLPKKSRIRLRFIKEFDSRAVDKLVNIFKIELEAKEIMTINDIQSSNDSILIDTQLLRLEDLRNVNIQEQLIEKYLEKQGVDNNVIKKVLQINAKHNDIIKSDEELIRNVNWKIINLNFSNVFSYKENNNINFEKLKGIIGIFGQNTIGKSSIIDAILYGLYNDNSKDLVKNLDVINTRKEKCNVKLDLEINKARYVIDRTTTKLVAGKRSNNLLEHAKTDVLFSKTENGNSISLNGLERSDTDKNIRKIFGTSEDFLTTCVSAQNDTNHFIEQKSTRRKEIIAKFLDLNIFEQKYRLAKEESYNLKSTLKVFGSKDFDKQIEKNKTKEKELKKNYKNKVAEKEDTLKSIKKIEKELSKLNKNYENIKYIDDYRDTVNEINRLDDINVSLSNEITDLTLHIESAMKQLDILQQSNVEDRIAVVNEKIENAKKLENRLKETSNTKEKNEITYKQLEKSIKLLSDIPCGDKFPQCKFIKDSYTAKNKIQTHETTIAELSKELSTLENQIAELKVGTLSLDKSILEIDRKETVDLQSKIERCNLKIENKNLELSNNKLQIDAAREKKKSLELLKILDIDTNNIKQNIIEKRQELIKQQTLLKSIEKELTDISRLEGEVSGAIKSLIRDSKEYKKTQDECYAYELYEKIMSKSGIQQEIIKSKLSAINSEINKLLRNVVKFRVQLVDNDNDKLDVYLNYNDAGGPRLIESASGAEKVFTSLAIRAALTRISTLPKPNIFIIDESFGVFDETNKLAITKMLQLLKQYFNTVMIITHITEIRDAVDWVLMIERDQDKFSYLS